ncbi:helix-turn-helix domain-containing protein [Marinobacterium arenosum]|uniref:helix-turn-helix domain-containing protein n=1 Tax=Marinobacterium arenosum TaxID=2862496 RepID=UPI001C9658D3|nr:AraC family transcriptional regulator [Marinobacterium arenosum]MBY4678525.1 AraC family transcriptional regulator [Marinobacterium arenosum]
MNNSLPDNHIFRRLSQSRANLQQAVALGDGVGVAIWSNNQDENTYLGPEHHTLSCYLDGGLKCQRLVGRQVVRGGAPGRICLMPAGHQSHWQINSPLSFLHLYFDQQHLKRLAERISDRDSRTLELQDLTFVDDSWIHTLCRQLMLPLNWQDNADRLALSSAGEMLMLHLLKHYSSDFQPPAEIRGGLAPYQCSRVQDYIEANLEQPLLLSELAAVTGLSEYHFARMFKKSTGQSPHQYVLERRLARAHNLLCDNEKSVSEIALRCGFSSQSHLNQRFKTRYAMTPGQLRRALG